MKMEPWQGNGLKVTNDGTRQGQRIHTEWSGMYDGKDHPVAGGPDASYTGAITRIGPRILQFVDKTDGKLTVTSRFVVSGDGRTSTMTQIGTNAEGHAVKNVIVFMKQ